MSFKDHMVIETVQWQLTKYSVDDQSTQQKTAN